MRSKSVWIGSVAFLAVFQVISQGALAHEDCASFASSSSSDEPVVATLHYEGPAPAQLHCQSEAHGSIDAIVYANGSAKGTVVLTCLKYRKDGEAKLMIHSGCKVGKIPMDQLPSVLGSLTNLAHSPSAEESPNSWGKVRISEDLRGVLRPEELPESAVRGASADGAIKLMNEFIPLEAIRF